ncbi:MAG: cytochrome ubiquinol oxidase subunit I [Porphyromonadaceae bacterium]|nr:cytochrome ubiquinol oxidase subunit I [Porphyromonadaceae bacterium]
MELLNSAVVDWSRGQFALTAMYHWLFVPLTLGLGVIQAIMETIYVKTGDEKWKKATKFWMSIFGINFAIGVATGIILEFQFGTNWSNYSYFVGDIFGAPLAIEGILAFFMEATFISIMFFGWNKVSKGVHLAATWLTITGATLSALWILIANAWMQLPLGMEFNPLTARNEMIDFWAVVSSPVAINKFFHTVYSGWILGSLFVLGVSAWYLLKKREVDFAIKSIRIAAIFGIISSVLIIWTGHGSAKQVAYHQPMKLAAMEGLYEGKSGAPLIAWGFLNPEKKSYADNVEPIVLAVKLPKVLSWMAFGEADAFVPGIKDIIDGGYEVPKIDPRYQDRVPVRADGTALSFDEKKAMGQRAQTALSNFLKAEKEKDTVAMAEYKSILDANYKNFGYGYLDKAEDSIPNVPLTFYSFRIMVILGGAFLLLFLIAAYLDWKKQLHKFKWILWVFILFIPLGYLATQLGWVVAEVGRQPWTIQDILPVQAAVSGIQSSSVKITFILFAVLFTGLLIAEIGIMKRQIVKGPKIEEKADKNDDSDTY